MEEENIDWENDGLEDVVDDVESSYIDAYTESVQEASLEGEEEEGVEQTDETKDRPEVESVVDPSFDDDCPPAEVMAATSQESEEYDDDSGSEDELSYKDALPSDPSAAIFDDPVEGPSFQLEDTELPDEEYLLIQEEEKQQLALADERTAALEKRRKELVAYSEMISGQDSRRADGRSDYALEPVPKRVAEKANDLRPIKPFNPVELDEIIRRTVKIHKKLFKDMFRHSHA